MCLYMYASFINDFRQIQTEYFVNEYRDTGIHCELDSIIKMLYDILTMAILSTFREKGVSFSNDGHSYYDAYTYAECVLDMGNDNDSNSRQLEYEQNAQWFVSTSSFFSPAK